MKRNILEKSATVNDIKTEEDLNKLLDKFNVIKKRTNRPRSVDKKKIPKIDFVCIDGDSKLQLMNCNGDDLNFVKISNIRNNADVDDSKQFASLLYSVINANINILHQSYIQFKFTMPEYIKNKWVELSPVCINRYYVNGDNEPVIHLPKTLHNNRGMSSNDRLLDGDECVVLMKMHSNSSIKLYDTLLQKGIDRSISSSVLPQSTYVTFYESGSLYSYFLLHKYNIDKTNDRELRDFFVGVDSILQKKFPETWAVLVGSF